MAMLKIVVLLEITGVPGNGCWDFFVNKNGLVGILRPSRGVFEVEPHWLTVGTY